MEDEGNRCGLGAFFKKVKVEIYLTFLESTL